MNLESYCTGEPLEVGTETVLLIDNIGGFICAYKTTGGTRGVGRTRRRISGTVWWLHRQNTATASRSGM